MFINISDSKEAANKGSSSWLVHYLEKENRLDKKNEPEYWFNGRQINIDPYLVMQTIDNNIAKLGKVDAKFFLVNISPSQKEIAFLKEQYSDDGVKDQLKGFAVRVMDAYAQNFKREGVNSHEDLVWFAKLENYRYYSYNDPEVKQGFKKRGDRKEGEHMHIQVIVSRKDATNLIKLSPMNTSRGKNEEHSKKMGQFDRVAFKQSGESLFDSLFEFGRQLKDTMAYANTQKNGSIKERVEMDTQEKEMSISADGLPWDEGLIRQAVIDQPENLMSEQIQFNITGDVDDEAVHGKNRHRHKPRWR
ncbi:DUF5712 family protein [Mucilaginibacter gilvus]|uniref:Molybdopterin-guanine dinucleotide biosynthesis protein MobB n=1 Tax=Mucilaginibacter gilvus TaxID=2305909 RepID=A0A3S3YM89_9SPHI|nr:DUF5712 family protein [Mucilaginibacter gilvus]RWY46055.1 molybdopterin-guanine dinucleotide biosynthesis protein MobB [Mucilaginibacter gilvus]